MVSTTVIPALAQIRRSDLPVSITITDRTRANGWSWFQAPPYENTYGYVESLLRIAIAQRLAHWDWRAELSQPSVLGLPNNAIASVAAQGQLGLGGIYVAANNKDTEPAAAFFKQGFARYHFGGPDRNFRIGRFEFFDGMETKPQNPSMAWLQANRISSRLISNFGFANAQRSFDGADAHYGRGSWDLTGFAARADQGVFNMNGNPELNVDTQYAAFTQTLASGRVMWRVFGAGYHDGRTGITKTDNRPLAARAADHQNIRIGTYGGNVAALVPAGHGQLDFMVWGVGQDGSWGKLDHRAGAVAAEAGLQMTNTPTAPWLRGGWFRSTGDNNPLDNKHNTFFQVLTTPRQYARDPYYNLMNSSDQFVQIMDKPTKRLALRSDLHWLQLTTSKDLWYQGGGAFDNKVFGYASRPSKGASSFSSVADISADYKVTKAIDLTGYYAHVWGRTVIQRIYPAGAGENFGYFEFNYRWGLSQKGVSE